MLEIQHRLRSRISKPQPLVRRRKIMFPWIRPCKSNCPASYSCLSTTYLLSTSNNTSKWYVYPKHEALYPSRLLKALIPIVRQADVRSATIARLQISPRPVAFLIHQSVELAFRAQSLLLFRLTTTTKDIFCWQKITPAVALVK